MKAWLLPELGGIEKLTLRDIPDPVPQAGEVVLAVHFASLNPADRYLSEGQYPARPAMPHVLGRDGTGEVIAVGPGVTAFGQGDRVAVLRGETGVSRHGLFAERAAVPVESIAAIPDGWSEEEAAAAPLVYLTAYQAITQWPDLPEGAVVLVTGASGGVGVASTQLASAMGHTVIGMSRSEQKSARLRELGAAATFDPNDTQWRKRAKAFLGERRVDLVIDNIGGTLLPETIDLLGMNGRVSTVGRLAGPVPHFNTASLFFRRVQIRGVAVGTYSPAECRSAWEDVLKLMSRANARPQVDRLFPFDQLPQAFERLAEGPMGKVLLKVSP